MDCRDHIPAGPSGNETRRDEATTVDAAATIRLLVVEDNPADVALLRACLMEAGEPPQVDVIHADRLQVAVEHLMAGRVDVVLLDLRLPDSQGMETIDRVRAAAPDVPVVVLTGIAHGDIAVAAFRRGVQDYVVKSTMDRTLPIRLQLAIERHRLGYELERANRKLSSANQELDAYATTVSHELKAPLRAVRAYTHYLLEDCGERLGDAGRQHLQRIRQAAERLNRLVESILSLSRAGRSDDARAQVSADEVAHRAIEQLREYVTERCGSVRVRGTLPEVWAQPLELESVFTNLISNGLKFNESSPPEVQIEAELREGDVLFIVADNGIGVAADDLPRMFECFHRLHPRERYEGAGAGLAICRKVVEAHGGRIWAESAPGEGTRIRFSLPQRRGDLP